MGFTGELVRTVFSRNRSIRSNESHVRSNSVEKRRWSSVRSYFCGDNQFNSVVAEKDSVSVSVESSVATVVQPMQEELTAKEEIKSEETVENITETELSSKSKSMSEEEAAILIQSAFRGFLTRQQDERITWKTDEKELNLVTESPDRKSMDTCHTSIEVQTGNSTDVFSVEGEKLSVHHGMQHRTRTQVIKQKENWDDSTVSSYVSKMKMQNRMEATTRRERALAYAFSQQLRICSKRKSMKSSSMEPNMSWSWLERWMATRLPDTSSFESYATKQYDLCDSNQRFTIRNRFLDVSREEKESCGSNEVPVLLDNCSATSLGEKDGSKPKTATQHNTKVERTVSRRKTVPSYQFIEEHSKVCKRDGPSNARKESKPKQKQGESRKDMKFDAANASNE